MMKNVQNGVSPDAQPSACDGFRQPSATYIARPPPAIAPRNVPN